MKNKLRKIQIEAETYLWKRAHHHLAEFEHSKCVEKVTIYLEGHKNSALQLSFREEDNLTHKTDLEKEKWCVGYPDTGVVWLFRLRKDLKPQTDSIVINLNRPAVIAALIGYFLQHGWQPKAATKPFVIEDALRFLEIIELPRGIE